MKKYKIEGQTVEGKNYYDAMAKTMQCSVAEAIAFRTHPADVKDCATFFSEAMGREPTDLEVYIMQPDSEHEVAMFWAGYRIAMWEAAANG